MNEFLDYMKTYIAEEFENDTSIAKVINVYTAYMIGHTLDATKPEIQIQILDNSEVTQYSSFENENVSYIPLQFTSYIGQLKINGIMKTAQEVAIVFGDKIKLMLNKLRQSIINKNILRCRITSMSPALPLTADDGAKIYTTAIRCEFWIANPYVVGD